jgi:tetratricopeptide (TPR) repeat protein
MPVSKKQKQHSLLVTGPERLQERVERAIAEGRFQQALELAKQLHKQEPSPAHQELLKRASLGRAEQLRQQGNERDAQTVLGNALRLASNDTATQEKVALGLARSGAIAEAIGVLERIPQAPRRNEVLALAADWAVQQGASARQRLPESLREPFDAVLAAFRHLEAGPEEALREQLQRIGLQSPFLEWKLLLRGLAAYFHNDDVRALENWQRLDLARVPARLAAPFRFQIDRAFRDAQPVETQNALRVQFDRLQGSGLVPLLRGMQAVFANREELPQAMRLAENLLPALRQQAPQLVPRLAACFFWAVVSDGRPEDVLRYQRVLGLAPDDPEVLRLRALQFEEMGALQDAHDSWRSYEGAITQHPATRADSSLSHLRALVWWRMGENAAPIPDEEQLNDLPPWLKDSPFRPRPLVPSAEKCFQKSLELNPKQLVTHEALFDYYARRKDERKAEHAGRRLLEHFPEHVPTLQALADLLGHRGDYAAALELLNRALKVNPLDRGLRDAISTAHLFHARSHAEAGRFDEARGEYQAALAYADGKGEASLFAKWAACEFKAGAAQRAKELLDQARAHSAGPLVTGYSMLIESIRLKLPRHLKARFERDFKTGLEGTPDTREVVEVAQTAAIHHAAGVNYHGQKTHEKKVLGFVDKARSVRFSERQLEELARALLQLEAVRPLRQFVHRGQAQFPRNPVFYLLEAESYYGKGPYGFPAWKVKPLLTRAHALALELPAGEDQEQILESIQRREEMARVGGMLSSPDVMEAFEAFIGGMDGYDDEDDEFEDS